MRQYPKPIYTIHDPDQYYVPRAVAQHFGCNAQTVINNIRLGRLAAIASLGQKQEISCFSIKGSDALAWGRSRGFDEPAEPKRGSKSKRK